MAFERLFRYCVNEYDARCKSIFHVVYNLFKVDYLSTYVEYRQKDHPGRVWITAYFNLDDENLFNILNIIHSTLSLFHLNQISE